MIEFDCCLFFSLFICYSRGWIEKFDRGSLFPSLHGSKKSDKRNNKSDDDDDDDDNDELGDDDLGLLIRFIYIFYCFFGSF